MTKELCLGDTQQLAQRFTFLRAHATMPADS